MNRICRLGVVGWCCLLMALESYGQRVVRDYGKINGSLESNLGYFLKDKKMGITDVSKPFAVNTWLTLGYTLKVFRFGLQYELYKPPLPGYFKELEGKKLMQGFTEYQDERLRVRIGNTYEQFGNGLIFRTYEDRSLGVNNSLLGVNVQWNPLDFLSLKAFVGKPRKFLGYTNARVYGMDGEVCFSDILRLPGGTYFVLGGSWVSRDDRTKERLDLTPAVVNLYAGRFNFSRGIFSCGAEYVVKSKALYQDAGRGYQSLTGNALLVNMGLDIWGVGCSFEFRRLENMELRADDRVDKISVALNYLPCLTKQHAYALAALYPHELEGIGEIGGQLDLFGEIPLGNSPLHYAVNGSMYRKLNVRDAEAFKYHFLNIDGDLLFGEIGATLSRTWGKSWEMTLAFIKRKKPEFSTYGFGEMMVNSEIVIGDVLCKFTPNISLRVELQHLSSDSRDDRRWAMGGVELGVAPHWVFWGRDMYNYRSAKESIHYFSIGGSFVWKNLRSSLSYGRNRAGMQCLGGICRYVPEYSGFNMLLTLTL